MSRTRYLAVGAVAAAIGIAACGSSGASSGGGASSSGSGSSSGSASYSAGGYGGGAKAAPATGAGNSTPASGRELALTRARVSVIENGSTTTSPILVTGSGRAVYLLTGDSRAHPECTSAACLSAWPPVTTGGSHAKVGQGVSGKVSIWKHDGIRQLVVAGHPLYTYAGDSRAGVATGDGLVSFGGTWKVIG